MGTSEALTTFIELRQKGKLLSHPVAKCLCGGCNFITAKNNTLDFEPGTQTLVTFKCSSKER